MSILVLLSLNTHKQKSDYINISIPQSLINNLLTYWNTPELG